MWRTQCGKSHGERGILPIYLPTTFRSHFAAKFSMQIVNIPMHIVCIPAGHFRCIHLFRTVEDSYPALIINHFRGENRVCLRMFTNSLRTKISDGYIFRNREQLWIVTYHNIIQRSNIRKSPYDCRLRKERHFILNRYRPKL